ncbi:tetratricopeptide repeat-containing sensor histidine kinase [Flavobacterium capsici]|uniref:histidine kinase n=1 Tax=Flavobacterium capsici TaxID=3075618 RepID=A0AA96EVW7_9FLAO|nr:MULTISPECIES: tetratricopeptide repeat protein [unclassified Flavobacterium]WNM19563.1 tetratricopeptide repeat protein [Flavobacterium sp. PMR2A8]WNM20952.1 tetratricopeptide repeat protein [Flavobacterium sp. PMTSA4]
MKNLLFLIIPFLIIISCSKTGEKSNSLEKDYSEISLNFDKDFEKISDAEKNKFLDSIYYKIKTSTNNKKNRDLLSKVIFKYYFLKDEKGIDNSSNLLIKLSSEEKDSINLGVAFRSRAFYYNKKLNIDSSFYYYVKAEKIYVALKDREIYANVLLNKGSIQYKGGDNLGAELTLTIALSIFKDINDFQKQFETLIALGNVSEELKDFDKAIIYYNKALELSEELEKTDKKHRKSICYNNLGFVYEKNKNFKKAISYFELGLKDKDLKNEFPESYSNLLDNLAFCKLNLNDFEGIENMFIESLKIREDFDYKSNVVLSHNHLSKYYKAIGNIEKSFYHANQALKISKEQKNPFDILPSLQLISEIDIKNSANYNKEYIRISDSLQLAERKSKDRFARIQLETDEIIQEKDKLEDKNRNLLYIFIGAVSLFSLLYFIRVQRARTRELLYKQAQQKANEDIFNLMMSQQAIIDESRTEEKQKLARELHDGVLGRMFGLRLNLDSVNHKNDEESVKKRLHIIEELKNIEQDIREISHDLNREKQVLINNFVSIVTNLLEEQQNSHASKLSYYLDTAINWDKVNSVTKINLYRILQESLQNINKYANATSINVGFVKNEDEIILKITDNGSGFDVNKKSKGIGTQNMIARTKECNGSIDIQSEIGEGTTITITIPINQKEKPQN